MIKYFAYGSNMDASRMISRGVFFSSRIPAKAKGCKLTFNKYSVMNGKFGYANIEHSNKGIVEGILYTIENNAIGLLDSFEGFPYHYLKTFIFVYDEFGERHKTITYVAHPSKVGINLKPTQDYLNHLLAGEDCLSEKYYQKLLKFKKNQNDFTRILPK